MKLTKWFTGASHKNSSQLGGAHRFPCPLSCSGCANLRLCPIVLQLYSNRFTRMRDMVPRTRFLLCIGDVRVPRHRRRQGGRHVASTDWTIELQVLHDGRESRYDVRAGDAANWE